MIESKEKKEWQEYSRKEKLNKVLHFVSGDLDKNAISKVYLIRKLNEKQDNKVFYMIANSINNQKYLWLSFKRNQEQFYSDYLDNEYTVYNTASKSYEVYLEVYLLIDKQNRYYFTVITDHAFFSGWTEP
jgi:hypothetical protein